MTGAENAICAENTSSGAEHDAGARNAEAVSECPAEPTAKITTVGVSSPTVRPPEGGLDCGSGGKAGVGDGGQRGGSLAGAGPTPAVREVAGTLGTAAENGVVPVVRIGAALGAAEPARKPYPGVNLPAVFTVRVTPHRLDRGTLIRPNPRALIPY